MTLNGVMAVILRYFSLNLVNMRSTHNRVDPWRNLCTSLLCFVVRIRCRRKESSRSLSHLLMSFLLYHQTRHKNYDTLGLRNVCCVTESNNSRGDWLNSGPTDMLLGSSIDRDRGYKVVVALTTRTIC